MEIPVDDLSISFLSPLSPSELIKQFPENLTLTNLTLSDSRLTQILTVPKTVLYATIFLSAMSDSGCHCCFNYRLPSCPSVAFHVKKEGVCLMALLQYLISQN